MVGTAPDGRGGVAAVVSVYFEAGLFEKLPIRYVISHCSGGMFVKLLKGFAAGSEIIWLLLTGQVALLHVHSSLKASFFRKSAYLALARLANVPTIFHLHSGEFDKFSDQYAAPWLRRWIVHTLTRSSRVVALSESWQTYVLQLAPAAKTLVIANPVPLPVVVDRSQEVAGRLLFLGRAGKEKGVFDLLEALKLVKQRLPQAHLALGGDGDVAAVKAYADRLGLGQSVEILGWVLGETKEQEYRRAEVFVLPSYREGLPMSMLECMARGKAMVVTPVGGIPGAVTNDEQGLFVPVGDVAALAEAMLRLLEQKDLRLRLGDAARLRVQERFSAEHVLGQLTRLYAEFGIHSASPGSPR